MTYAIEYSHAARHQIRRLPPEVRIRLVHLIAKLADDPRPPGTKKLSGPAGLWRVRAGVYRVVYEVRDTVLLVVVVRVAHRAEAYRR